MAVRICCLDRRWWRAGLACLSRSSLVAGCCVDASRHIRATRRSCSSSSLCSPDDLAGAKVFWRPRRRQFEHWVVNRRGRYVARHLLRRSLFTDAWKALSGNSRCRRTFAGITCRSATGWDSPDQRREPPGRQPHPGRRAVRRHRGRDIRISRSAAARPIHYACADRFCATRPSFRERWDATVLHIRERPGHHIRQAAGRPAGRTGSIRDGAVWVNGERLIPPDRLGPIRMKRTGLATRILEPSMTLGPDEYLRARRQYEPSGGFPMWGPVKRDLIIGVADLIYWPPARWRVRP